MKLLKKIKCWIGLHDYSIAAPGLEHFVGNNFSFDEYRVITIIKCCYCGKQK